MEKQPINDGGSAFPEVFTNGPSEYHGRDYADTYSAGGMSLRDWFAGQALGGELAAQSEATGEWPKKGFGTLAARCYSIADAMLAARNAPLTGA